MITIATISLVSCGSGSTTQTIKDSTTNDVDTTKVDTTKVDTVFQQ
jgi:hypothetical protein